MRPPGLTHRHRRRTQRGLTLMELLVTVVIFSLVITVFSQAMFQVSLFERTSARNMGVWQRDWASGFGLDDYFRSQVLAPEAKEPQTLGDSQIYHTWWLEQAGDGLGRPVPVDLALRPLGRAASEWGLFARSKDGAELQLARWPTEVRFRFVDASGRVSDVWPSPQAAADVVVQETIPRAVQLVDAQEALVHQWVYPGITQGALAQYSRGQTSGLAAP